MTALLMGISGRLKDFMKAFPLAIKGATSIEIRQVKRSLLAVKTAMITINVVGTMFWAMGAVIILGRLDDITSLGPNLAVASLTFVYGLVATLLLIPIYIRLKAKLIEE